MSEKITTATPPAETNGEQGWHTNTELSVDLKTVLRSDRRMRRDREYRGVLRRDGETEIGEFRFREAHLTFTETLPEEGGRRNPKVYDGRFITVTRWDDASLHPNFKALPRGMSVDGYAIAVCNELRQALAGLVEDGQMRE